jgi:hypothetical protein
VLLLAGCGPSGPKTYEVSGTVTWNREPVADGWINFYPLDGTITPEGGAIKNGQYRFRARPGKKRVEITASREGKFNPVMQSPERESYIPPAYNGDQSVLSAEVRPDGENQFAFHLPLKP